VKYLVLLAVLLVVYLLWRYERRTERDEARATTPTQAPPVLAQEMVRCPVCSVHLPRADALVDARGRTYCCAEHRQKDAG
jgi:uncharacterized protein